MLTAGCAWQAARLSCLRSTLYATLLFPSSTLPRNAQSMQLVELWAPQVLPLSTDA